MVEQMLSYEYGYGMWGAEDDFADDAEPPSDGGGSEPTDYTTTNVQEEGVDEIDIVKTDGTYIYVAQDQAFHIVDSWPAEEAHKVSSLELEGWTRGLFLYEDTVVIFANVYGEDSEVFSNWSGTRMTVIDVTDRSAPVIERTIDVDGYLTDGRMIDGDVYAVMNHWMQLPQEAWEILTDEDLELPEVDAWSLPEDERDAALEVAREEARAIIEPVVHALALSMDLDTLLPVWRDQVFGEDDADVEGMHACSDLYRPSDVSRLNVLSLVNLDLKNDDLNATGLLSDGWTLYASKDNLYVAQTSWWWWWGWGDLDLTTYIHTFKLDPDSEPTYTATGVVEGWLYDQFAMSEYDGHLRVATTDFDWWWWTSEDEEEEAANNLFVLKNNDAGVLEQVGELRGIAPGERIFASRMLGKTGYVVTFRQTDPLFTIDLSEPTAPKLLGELHMPGFSSYLHPMEEGYLLAVGRDGEEDGTITGLAVNVFDVRDLTNPMLAHQYTLETTGWSWSEALWDHHAFTFHRSVLSIPAYSVEYDATTGAYDRFSGLVSFHIDAIDGITELGRVNHRDLVEESECLWAKWYEYYDDSVCDDWGWYAQVRRSIYIEDNLFSISNYGMKINDLNSPETEHTRVVYYPAE